LRPVLGGQVQGRRAVDDLHQLVAVAVIAPSRYGASCAADPSRSALVVCGVRPRSIVSFANSALRSMIVITVPSPLLNARSIAIHSDFRDRLNSVSNDTISYH
jgi:hypothetical protein